MDFSKTRTQELLDEWTCECEAVSRCSHELLVILRKFLLNSQVNHGSSHDHMIWGNYEITK